MSRGRERPGMRIAIATAFLGLGLGGASIDDPSGRFRAAWDAIESGRPDLAGPAIRSLHTSNPEFRPAARLVGILDRLEAPCPDPDLRAIRAQLPGGWSESKSAHFLLFHRGTEAQARSQLDLAERVLATYYLWFGGIGFDLKTPDRKLVSARFASRDDYVGFLESRGEGSFADTQGHFDPAADLVLIAEDGPEVPGDRPGEGLRKAREIATVAHETVHQLVARSGLERPGSDWPRWLQEGIAMLFEPSRDGDWAGIRGPNPHRLPLYRAIRPAPGLAATVRDLGFRPRYDPDRYGAAWALVEFLSKRHPREFVTILDRLRTLDPAPVSTADRASDAFRSAFGDGWARIEGEWHAALTEDARSPRPDSRWTRGGRTVDR